MLVAVPDDDPEVPVLVRAAASPAEEEDPVLAAVVLEPVEQTAEVGSVTPLLDTVTC